MSKINAYNPLFRNIHINTTYKTNLTKFHRLSQNPDVRSAISIKLKLTQTNPAKENLMRKIDAENTAFSTIESFKRQGSAFANYKLLVIP